MPRKRAHKIPDQLNPAFCLRRSFDMLSSQPASREVNGKKAQNLNGILD